MRCLVVKYKIGDKVKIKTWKEMEKEYGLKKNTYYSMLLFPRIKLPRPFYFSYSMEKELNNSFSIEF